MRWFFLGLSLLTMPVYAGFSEGVAAYQRGGYDTALREFVWQARQGNVAAQYNAAYMYARGLGTPRNYYQAFLWFSRAAEHGDAESQYYLAGMYESGVGVAQDYGRAAEWYRRAAAQGDVNSQLTLGGMYGIGLGVRQSYSEAYGWFRLAAAQGNTDALKGMDILAGAVSDEQLQKIEDFVESMSREYSRKRSM